MLTQDRIITEMHKLEKILGYEFKKIDWLAEAMKSEKIDSNNYSNERLAFLGDTLIKFLIAEKLYKSKNQVKGDMTKAKAALENNDTFHKVAEEDILKYAYNDDGFAMDKTPPHKAVRTTHDPYIEAIAAAIYLDRGWRGVRKWFNHWLYPRLEKHKKVEKSQ